MDVKGHSRICGQCHKEVAVDNFALHESHCRRFLCVCPDCDETVPREQLEQHRRDEHTQVNCSECNQKMECRLLMDHKFQECVARLLSCEFCELELPCRELEEHKLVCGSRTERCSTCKCYILLRDLAQHTHTCPAAAGVPPPPLHHPRPPQITAMTPDKSKVICIGCMGFFPSEDMEEHKLGCTPAWRSISQEEEEEEEEGASALKLPREEEEEEEEEEGDPDWVHPCSHCQLVLPHVTLRWHEPKCKIHLSMK